MPGLEAAMSAMEKNGESLEPEKAAEEKTGETANTGANTGAENEPPADHPRFKEVYGKMKEYERKLADYESRHQKLEKENKDRETQRSQQTKRDRMIALRVGQGWTEPEAKEDVDAILGTVQESVQPLKEKATEADRAAEVQKTINDRIAAFKETHEDFDKLEPEMDKLYKSYPPAIQAAIFQDPNGLEFLYKQVVKTPEASQPRTGKVGGRSTGTRSSSGYKFKESEIAAMSTDEFAKLEAEIDAALKRGEVEMDLSKK